MFYGGGLFGLVFLFLWIWAIVDVIQTPDGAHRNLPKIAWIVITILFGGLGALAWIAFGRPHGARAGFGASGRPGTPRPSRGIGRGRGRSHPALDERPVAHALSERERLELERREYYRRMDEELDRRLEQRDRDGGTPE